MAKKIDKMKDQNAYDELTNEIKVATENQALDGILVESIKDIKEESAKEWKDKDKQVLKIMSKHAVQASDVQLEMTGSLKDTLIQEAEAKGLKDHMESVLDKYGDSDQV